MLDDLLCYQSTDFRRYGFLEAVTSDLNENAQGSEFIEKYNAQGTPIESCLRWYREECDKAETDCDTNDICVEGDPIDTLSYFDVEHGAVWCDSKKWTIQPCDMNELCFDNVAMARARMMQKYVNKIVENANKYFLDLVYDQCGGIYDHRTNTVSAAGTPLSFNILGPSSQPSAMAFNDLNRFFTYNGCSRPIVVHGDNALVDYIRFQQLDAYCCNQEGVQLDQLQGFLGFDNYLDNSGGVNADIPFTDAVAWEPGSVRLRDSFTGRGDCVWEYDHFGKTTFVGPYGLVFDYQWRVNDCTGAMTEKISLSLELFTKPLGINDCDLAGTNGIFCLEFLSCANDICP